MTAWVNVVAQFGMTDFVGDEKGSFERCARIFVKDQIIARDEHRSAAVKHGGAFCSNFDI